MNVKNRTTHFFTKAERFGFLDSFLDDSAFIKKCLYIECKENWIIKVQQYTYLLTGLEVNMHFNRPGI